jgi:hypothetical protein
MREVGPQKHCSSEAGNYLYQSPIQVCALANRQVLVGDHVLLRDFGPYGIFMNVSVVITVKVKQSLYTPWRRLGGGGIAPTHSRPRH